MALALFDLDNTLLVGDSDYLWGCFLVEMGVVDSNLYEARNLEFYQDYQQGTLDIHEYLKFQLGVLAQFDMETLNKWRKTFIQKKIRPLIAPGSHKVLDVHRRRGDTVMIITATNLFVTEPIAKIFGVEWLLATELETNREGFTGRPKGIPCFQEGKVKRLETWIAAHGDTWEGSWFYSDSCNDIPLLERVEHPVAVDPDERLRQTALARGWQIQTFREVNLTYPESSDSSHPDGAPKSQSIDP